LILSEKNIVYQICVQGHTNVNWTEWLQSLKVTQKNNGVTVLTGSISDQSALRGLLDYLFDLGITLLSLKRMNYPGLDSCTSFIKNKIHHLIF
jgi:hypothetical protein